MILKVEQLSCIYHFNFTHDFCYLGKLTYWTCLVYCVLALSYEGDGVLIFQHTLNLCWYFLWLVVGWLSFLLEYTVTVHVVPDLSVRIIVTSYCWHFKFFQSMILKFELLGLDDRRKSLDNSTHCLNEGVSVLNACYCLTWLNCLLWLILKHLVFHVTLNPLSAHPYVTEFIQENKKKRR